MKCRRCDTTEEKFLSVVTYGVNIPTEYLCIHCEVTDERHCDCRLQEQEEQDPRFSRKGEHQDCFDGTITLLQEEP